MVRQELSYRSLFDDEHHGRPCVVLLKWVRLRQWFIGMEDRQQRLTLVSLGRVHRVEIHYRVGIGY